MPLLKSLYSTTITVFDGSLSPDLLTAIGLFAIQMMEYAVAKYVIERITWKIHVFTYYHFGVYLDMLLQCRLS